MIPWFIPGLVQRIVWPFGYCVHVKARTGALGCDRFWLVKRGSFDLKELKV